MRFNKFEKFKIDDLLLDEGNYRFKKAEDQKACVRKIHNANILYIIENAGVEFTTAKDHRIWF